MPWYGGCRTAAVRRVLRAFRISVLALVFLFELALIFAPETVAATLQPERDTPTDVIERPSPFRHSLPGPCGRCGRRA
jgi:hypothetical protein